jgi:hypothetical protein
MPKQSEDYMTILSDMDDKQEDEIRQEIQELPEMLQAM